MKRVKVRSAAGDLIDMLSVDESAKLVYVISPDSVERLQNGLTEPVGCPKKDIISQEVNAY